MKYCPDCEQDKPLTDFYNSATHSQGKMYYCKKCFNIRCIKRWIQRKIDMILYYGGKCTRCDLTLEESHYSVFEFHHRNSKEKEFSWDKLRLQSIDKIKKELNKCDLLCANCHRIVHSEV